MARSLKAEDEMIRAIAAMSEALLILDSLEHRYLAASLSEVVDAARVLVGSMPAPDIVVGYTERSISHSSPRTR